MKTPKLTKYRFETFHHPFSCEFLTKLESSGLDGLLRRDMQSLVMEPVSILGNLPFPFPHGYTTDSTKAAEKVFAKRYIPVQKAVAEPYPIEEVEFRDGSPFGTYNFELFFHALHLITDRLLKNQRPEDALKWIPRYLDLTAQFSDTEKDLEPDKDPAFRVWKFLPFYRNTDAKQSVQELLALLHIDPDDPKVDSAVLKKRKELIDLIDRWADDPFNPHLLARYRLREYQMAVVMLCLDCFFALGELDWARGDIDGAAQWFILAGNVLGSRPEEIPPREVPSPKTYNELEPLLDSVGQIEIQIESLLPYPVQAPSAPQTKSASVLPLATIYFCIPENEPLLKYWDRLEDRLFKLRHCLDVEGQVTHFPLFEAPLDVGLLIRAKAAGVDLASLLNDLYAPLPPLRPRDVIRQSLDFCAPVQALGNALLAALEKKDAEEVALLRAGQEADLLEAVREVKKHQVTHASTTLESLNLTKTLSQNKSDYYAKKQKIYPGEQHQFKKLQSALTFQNISAMTNVQASVSFAAPTTEVGSSGQGPHAVSAFGGTNMGHLLQAFSHYMGMLASIDQAEAVSSKMKVDLDLRWEDFDFQKRQADDEIKQIQKQIEAANVALTIANKELENHETQMDDARAVESLLRSKYTNQERYQWMIDQLSETYFQSYKLAYVCAKRAERAVQFALASDESFIKFGYWDSLSKGLLAGDKLCHDLRRMEAAFLDNHRRQFELTKHISLALIDPIALIQLKEAGECFVDFPETLFDMDYPGHYMRLIQSVAVTIPCVTGPYTNVNSTLTMLTNRARKDPSASGTYDYQGPRDHRFEHNRAAIQSIATSHAQNDSGLFELNFHDELLLPFEGAGAISSWRLELPLETNSFDRRTIMDVVFTIRYRARNAGEPLKIAALDSLPSKGARMFSLRHEFPGEWHRFINPATITTAERELKFPLTDERFPYSVRRKAMTTGSSIKIGGVHVFALARDGASLSPEEVGEVQVNLLPFSPPGSPPGPGKVSIPLTEDPTMGGILHGRTRFGTGHEKEVGNPWTLQIAEDVFQQVVGAIEDVVLVFEYAVNNA